LRLFNGDEHLVIFMDNLSVHKSNDVYYEMQNLNMTAIFNVPYSPQYNGIESYFFLLK
jgi:transposase